MPRFDAFCGPFNSGVSANIQSELTINWMPERAMSVNGMGTDVSDKNVRCSLVRTPGIKLFTTLPKTPVRGVFPGEYRLFAAAGDSWYEVFADGTYTDRSVPGFTGSNGLGPDPATIGNDGRPVQAFFNGTQVLIISHGQAYCDSGNGSVAAQFSDPLTDLLIDPADAGGFTLTKPDGGPFDLSDSGKTLQITQGAGFYLISQTISIDGSGRAIGGSSWGIPGSGLGKGRLYLGDMILADLELITPTVVHSASRPFGVDEIGTTLTIAGGTGWTLGTYTITGLVYAVDGTPTGDAIIDPAGGSAGATAGAGEIAAMMVTALQGAFLDGYYFVTPYPRTKTIYYSGINDGNIWEPLHYFQKGNYPDNVAALFSDHQELYTFGNLESTQVWRDVGNLDTPFAPDQGAAMHIGCQAPFSVVRLGNGVAWIGEDVRRGTRRAYHSTGYNPVAVSTPGVEVQWATYSDVTDAVAYTIADQGHECWVINFPTANATWVYDSSTGWWHQRGYWNGGSSWWDRQRVWVHCVVAIGFGEGTEAHYGGDWENGKIYTISSAWKTDDGHVMIRRRLAPHLTNENMRRFYSRFEIDCDVLGRQRVYWNRLGTGRDRIWGIDAMQTAEDGGVTLTLGYSDDRLQSSQTMYAQVLDPAVDVRLANAYLNYVDASWH
jgi:hypothetical protein